MSGVGHNERAYRLDVLASEAREGLLAVAAGEQGAIDGWIAYGKALNEGRALFPGDKEFGEWIAANALRQLAGAEVEDHERAAAMWAAANADELEEARAASNARTLRGLHAKWKEIEAERARAEEEARRGAERPADTQHTVLAPAEATESVAPPSPLGSDGPPAEVSSFTQPVAAIEADEPAPDPYGYAGLTEGALLETANGLRDEVDELRATVKAQASEAADLRAHIKELSSDNLGATVSSLRKEIGALKLARDDAKTAAKRMEYRMKKAEARVRELESAGVAF